MRYASVLPHVHFGEPLQSVKCGTWYALSHGASCNAAPMKMFFAFVAALVISGCVVDEHRNCARNERWDGHHCMVDAARVQHDRDVHDDHHDDHHDEGGVRDHR